MFDNLITLMPPRTYGANCIIVPLIVFVFIWAKPILLMT